MKKHIATLSVAVTAAAILCGLTATTFAQTETTAASQFLDQAKSASDSQLGDIASQLTGKITKLESLLGSNTAIKDKLASTLKSLTGGQDSAALASAFDLAKGAKFTPNNSVWPSRSAISLPPTSCRKISPRSTARRAMSPPS